ncbi:MAG: type II toxin-antitoxin system VapC family toxin [Verrucomicrobiae bacterium]|nr:type II toxin-antitoxin system VapC family toxin [Verrucomicrobiae bacterium]
MNGDIVLVDAGPVVAFLIRDDAHHPWAKEQFAHAHPPLLTCEPVLSEACHVANRLGGDAIKVMELMEKKVLEVAFTMEDHIPELLALMRRYRDVPMSLADACLVRMSELHRRCHVMTTDSDFRLYRRNARQVIPLLAPW